jgi:hypothetical protein
VTYLPCNVAVLLLVLLVELVLLLRLLVLNVVSVSAAAGVVGGGDGSSNVHAGDLLPIRDLSLFLSQLGLDP